MLEEFNKRIALTGETAVSPNWNNNYSEGRTGIASESPADVFRLLELVLQTISAHDGKVSRTAMLEALAIAQAVLSGLENAEDTDDIFDRGDFYDINGVISKSD